MVARSILHLRLKNFDRDSATGNRVPSLIGFCRRTTPTWELSPCGAYLDLTGTERLYGPGIDGAALVSRSAISCLDINYLIPNRRAGNNEGPVAAGSGPTRLTAGLASLTAARAGGGILAVLPHQVSVFLQPFPVDFLPARRSVVSRLHQLGVRTLGDLQVVPRSLLGSVFGPDGGRLADEALGSGTGVTTAGKMSATEQTTGLELVVGIRLPRPVSSDRLVSALGLDLDALTVTGNG